MKNASHESCQFAWDIFKRKAELLPGTRFGNVPRTVKWPSRLDINVVNRLNGYDEISQHTYTLFRRLFRQGRDYITVGEGHYGVPIQDNWQPIAAGTFS